MFLRFMQAGFGTVILVTAVPAVAAEVGQTAPVVVTANRVAQTADQTLASVTVIDRTEIERRQATSLPDLLRGVPGLDVTSNGPHGKLSSIFMRGTESNHTLVLIDGLEVNSPFGGATSIEFLPLSAIERIEIVRGPRSSLYGSEAIGGVIQIFTRRGGGPTQLQLEAGAGAHQQRQYAGAVSGESGRARYSLSAGYSESEGINTCEGSFSAGCFTFEPDHDGYRNGSWSARAGYRMSQTLDVEAHALHSEGHTEFDGGFANETDFREQVLGVRLQWRASDSWTSTLHLGETRDERQNLAGGAHASFTDSRRESVTLQNDVLVGDHHRLVFGAEYQDDRIEASSDFTRTGRYNRALFGQWQSRVGTHDLIFGLRHDDNEQFGGETTGQLAWGRDFAHDLRLRASVGTAFVAPTFNDLYFPAFPPFFFPNPDLDPETSVSYEVGVSQGRDWGRWEVSLYYSEIDDLITFDAAEATALNFDEAQILGLDASVHATLRGWDVGLGLSLLEPEVKSAGDDSREGNLLPRRAEQSLQLDLDRRFGRFAFGLTGLAQGRRFDDAANSIRLGGYGVIHLRAAWFLNPQWTLRAKLENALGRDYERVNGFEVEEQAAYVSVTWRPAAGG